MSVVKYQDFWTVGARVYFQQDPISAVVQPTIDFGVISSASPTQTIEKIELEDPDGGQKNTVDESVTKIDETWNVTGRNFAPKVMEKLFLSNPSVAFTQSAADKAPTIYCHPDAMVKLVDTDAAATPLFMCGSISGVVSAMADLSTAVVTDVSASAKTITTSTDISTHLSASDKIVLRGTGLTNLANAKTYTVVSVTTTVITVSETPSADESTITGSLIYAATADTGTIYSQDVDWKVTSLDRGLIEILGAGAITTAGNKDVIFRTAAISGNRLLNPQSAQGAVKGKVWIILGRDNNVSQSVREANVSLTPSGMNLQVDDFSEWTLDVKVISDLTATDIAGRLLSFKGTLPTHS